MKADEALLLDEAGFNNFIVTLTESEKEDLLKDCWKFFDRFEDLTASSCGIPKLLYDRMCKTLKIDKLIGLKYEVKK